MRAGNGRAALNASQLARFPHAAPRGREDGYGQKPIRRLIRLLSFATNAPSLRGSHPVASPFIVNVWTILGRTFHPRAPLHPRRLRRLRCT